MRRRLLALLTATLLLAALGPAQAIPHRFADLHWGADRSEAHPTLTRLGWRFTRQAAYGDAVYAGTVAGHPARATLKYDLLGRLVAVDLRVTPPADRILAVYRTMRSALTLQYGPPAYTQASFRPPYREGDGREVEALKSQHAILDTVWVDRDALNLDMRSGVQLDVNTVPFGKLEVQQFSLSNDWTEEYQRRAGPAEENF
ncbi:hypothetical protein [Deinococcus budaensis]|uniref:DUF3108 domain-containing protein n=1 Tax=Deinococcus budaensis TaxID=1665626 RepID=A0A7W8LQ25_9DEIO|nr:hypothetical protein [Deinococcus budaensis]MBB5234304.1 hypothetical protein [Deinococcus budaensis]